MREIAEMQARQLVERFTGNLPGNLPGNLSSNLPAPQTQAKASRDKKTIYLLAGFAVILFVSLALIIYALIQYL